MNQIGKKIILLGATGYTGRLVVALLSKNKISVCLSGRSTEKLSELNKQFDFFHSILVVDVLNQIEVVSSLKNFDIIINCVGPFNLWGKQVLEFCRENGKIYLDITGEQHFIQESIQENDAALQSGASIIHSVSFESALAEILAAEIVDPKLAYKEISTYYYFDKSRPSPGTRLTMQLARKFPTYHCEGKKLVKEIPLAFSEKVSFDFAPGCTSALFMPYPEVVFFQKKYDVEKSSSYLLVDNSTAMMLQASSKNPELPLETILAKHFKVNPQGPGEEERLKQQFVLAIKAVDISGVEKFRVISGNDMYQITAFLIVKLIRRIVNENNLHRGVLTPVEAGGWENVWEEMANDGIVIEQIRNK